MKINQKAIETVQILSAEMSASVKTGDYELAFISSTSLYSLFKDHYNFFGGQGHINRDRFVFSDNSSSAVYYSLMHLFGFDVSGVDLRNFALKNEKASLIPLLNTVEGIDASSGPSGHGIATAVGLAMSQAHLAEKFNVQRLNILNNHTYCFVSGNCLVSGVAQEAINLAGTLKLNRLILFYTFLETKNGSNLNSIKYQDLKKSFRAVGWKVLTVFNARSYRLSWLAIKLAKRSSKPTLIIFKMKPNNCLILGDLCSSQNKTLTYNQVEKLKAELNHIGSYNVSNEVKQFCMRTNRRLKVQYSQWQRLVVLYKNTHPELAEQLNSYYEKPNISLLKFFKNKLSFQSNKDFKKMLDAKENFENLKINERDDLKSLRKPEQVQNYRLTEFNEDAKKKNFDNLKPHNRLESNSKILRKTNIKNEILSQINLENFVSDEIKLNDLLNFNNEILNYISEIRPCLVGGNVGFSDLLKVLLKEKQFSKNYYRGKNIVFGNRISASGSICNGISLYFGAPCFCACPLALMENMIISIRLSAQMNLPILYIFTKDKILDKSFGIELTEQLAELRNLKNLMVFRPMNKTELLACHSIIYETECASALILSSESTKLQVLLNSYNLNFLNSDEVNEILKTETLSQTKKSKTIVKKYDENLNKNLKNITQKNNIESFFEVAKNGAYIISEDRNAEIIIFASGGEVYLALKTKELLNKQNYKVCVVSVPSLEVFEKQSQKYKDSILQPAIKTRIAVEASNDKIWYKYIGSDGVLFNLPAISTNNDADISKEFNLNAKNLATQIKKVLKK